MSRRWERERDTVLRLARRAYNSGRWQSAIAHYERAVRIDPHDVHAFLKLGELYQRVGDISRAIQAFRSATEIYKCRGFYLKSIVVYKQILQLDATQIDIHVKLAELYHQLGLVTDAIAQYEIVAARHTADGQMGEALDILRRATQADPENVPMRLKYAEQLLACFDHDAALAEFHSCADRCAEQQRHRDYIHIAERALQIDPDDAALRRTVAERLIGRREFRRALDHLQQCYRHDPKDAETLTLLADTFLAMSDREKVASVMRLESELAGHRKLFRMLGDLFRRIGAGELTSANAALRLQSALEGNVVVRETKPPTPTVIDPHAKLLAEARVYVEYGLVPRAIAHLDHILQEQPNHEEAQHLRDELMGSPPRRLEVIEGEPFEVCTSGDGLFNTVGDRDNEPTAASPNADAPKDAAGGVQDHSERSSVPPSDAPTCDGTCDDCGCFSRDTPDED